MRLRELLGGGTVDVAFDAIGGESARTLLDLLTPVRGRMLSYGWLSGVPAQVSAADLLPRGLGLIGCAGPDWLAQVDAAREQILDRAAAGNFDPLIDSVLPLAEAATAHRLIEARTPRGRILLRP